MKYEEADNDEFALPLTPMIDIIFLLLIFFLLSTTIINEERNLKIKLPAGTKGAASVKAAGTRLWIGVQKDGGVSLGGQSMSWAELRKRLRDAGARSPKPVVVVRGDRHAAWDAIARVFQLCGEAKIREITTQYRFEERGPNK